MFATTASAVKQSWARAVARAQRNYLADRKTNDREMAAGFLDELTFHDLRHEATSRLAEKLALHELMKVARAFDTSSKVTRERKRLAAIILAGADTRLNRFVAWAARAENLANFASYRAEPIAHNGREPGHATARAVALARKIKVLCRGAISRADELRLEALSAADIGLELEAMASGIYEEFNKLPSGATMYQMPSDYMAPLM